MQATKSQKTVSVLLGLFLIFTGSSHLTFQRTAFLAQVPNWLPINADLVVLISGAIEIILGISLLFLPELRVIIGWVIAFFFVAVFPGNIAQLVNQTDAFGLNTDLLRWLRLPLQPLLIILVLWSTNAWRKWRDKIKLDKQFDMKYFSINISET